ncbi:hypothetical protein CFP65_7599 [Kitasatospora sp. MMS16-BH015]|uniref:hypothetical protein n=1 Tax=Kitasatospora sp. MMS16-BH015 TaxID=2018025 RepID=UPI000CA17209|nr:hypothetical protein [Kitasatospora sp. MMS16-BH015]AUG82170.1 hypothetical protein CFP65_7599 [Kitasatospora sp. MMS16-BH015]
MLAVASLAAGVVASLTAPSAHAAPGLGGGLVPTAPSILNTAGLLGVLGSPDAPDAPHDSAEGHPDRPFR